MLELKWRYSGGKMVPNVFLLADLEATVMPILKPILIETVKVTLEETLK